MLFTIERDPMVRALEQVEGAVVKKADLLVLMNVLLTAENDRLSIVSTNLDIEVQTSAVARVTRPGTITAPADELYEIARRAPQGAEIEVDFSGDKDVRLTVRAGRAKYTLPVLPAGDFPVMPATSGGSHFTLLRSELQRLIDKTKHAVSTDDTRYCLTGAFLHPFVEDGSTYLRVAATDGHQLAYAEIPAPEGLDDAQGVIIPRKTLQLIRQVIESVGPDVEITTTPSKIIVRTGDTVITSKVIDGSFPDYMRVIPRGQGSTVATLNAATLAASVERAGIVARDKSHSVRLDFTPEGLALSCRNEQGGQSSVQIEVEPEGQPTEIGFNARLLRHVTSLFGDRDLAWHVWGSASATRVDDPEDEGLAFVIMPLRV